MDINFCEGAIEKFHDIRCISFGVVLVIKCFHIKTDIHFQKIVKSCSRLSKACKSVKIASLNFLRKKLFCIICVEKIKSRVQHPLVSYIHINHIKVIFYCKHLVYKILCYSIQLKPISAYLKNSEKTPKQQQQTEQLAC